MSATIHITPEQLAWNRLRRSGLMGPFPSPQAVAAALVGVQSQFLPSAALAIANRSNLPTYSEFERLLYRERSLVKLWGQRGTLHIYDAQDWPLMVAAQAGQQTWWDGILAKDSQYAARYRQKYEQVLNLLKAEGVLTRGDLVRAGLDLDQQMLNPWGGVFADLVRNGHACHAGQKAGESAFAARASWLPGLAWNLPDSETANQILARRYLQCYGPVSERDLIYWRGGRVPPVRRWLEALRPELLQVNVSGRDMLIHQAVADELTRPVPEREAWPVHLLHRFETVLMSYMDKDWLVEPVWMKRISRPAGHIEPVVMDAGRIVATWKYERSGRGLRIAIFPFGVVDLRVKKAIEEKAIRVADFFGQPLSELEFIEAP